jgi:hypothetical protein
MPVKNRIQLRRGTSTQWSNNVILAFGELGWDTTVNNVKIGDGSNLWDDLPWLVVAGVSGQIINPAVISGVSGIFFDTSVGDVDQIAGQLGWNSEAGTFDVGLTDDLKISVGQSVLFRVKNSTGSTITKGEAVYASGVLGNGQIIQVAPFVADETIPEVRFIGLMLDDLADGEDGFVAEFGHIKNVDLRTTNTVLNPNGETWAVGDILFVDDASAGGLTKVQPKNDIYVAMVLADGQNGELFVRVTNPGHINDLHDVNTSGVVDNNLLVWNSGADYWEPTTSMTFDGTTLHLDTDGVSAKFGRDNALTAGGKVRIFVDDSDTAGSVQAIKAFNNKNTGVNYGINATAYGSGTRNVALYGYAQRADQNWGLQVAAGISYFQDNIGIKNSNPVYELDVAGSGNITGDVFFGSDATVTGHLAASTKSFLIDHPTKKGKKLQYGSLESPYHGVRLTGRDKLQEGICVIKLPSYMKKLVREEDISIQITNYKHHKTLYVDDIDLAKNTFTVKGHRCKTLGELEFFWSFTAVRKDVPELTVEK